MHLSVDSLRTLGDVRAALSPALAAASLHPTSTRDLPAGGFVVELSDPLPALESSATPADVGNRVASPTDLATYRIAVYARAGGGSRLSTIRPTHLVELLGKPEWADAARALEHRLERALFAAAGRETDAPAR